MDKRNSLAKLVWLNIRKSLSRIKEDISDKYNKLKGKLDQNTKKLLETDFKDLAPCNEIEKGEEYFKALDWALKNENVYNIAVTGPYGSGKSSVIRAYLKKSPNIKSINISLASFVEVKKNENGEWEEKRVDFDEKRIEEGILKQLFYKVNYKRIPQSRFRKLHNVNGFNIYIKIVLLMMLTIAAVSYFSTESSEGIISTISNKLSEINTFWSGLYVVGITAAVLALISYAVWWISSKYKVREWNLADKASLASKAEDNESVFNKNMDEIVYFFEATDFDTVFIEDLDRFESTEVFIKLRELNTILNNYEMINRRIIFVYAVKDDMFTDKDRTKFFDFIIPVIPFINQTNSGEILLKRLTKEEKSKDGKEKLKYDISPEFIIKISPYIEDMRVLTNVYNEFVIYKNTLGDIQDLKLIDEQMISLMIFKNLYPKDFADLQMEKGIVKTAFEDKKRYITNQCYHIQEEKKKDVEILEGIEGDILSNIRELKAAMLYYLSDEKGTINYISINGRQYRFSDIFKEDFDMNQLMNEKFTVNFIYGSGSTNSQTVNNIDDITSLSGNTKSYIERWQYLKDSIPDRQKEMRKHIKQLDLEEHDISSLSMKDLISKYGVEKVFSSEIKENKLLIYLLRSGYIDETYANYINYFHPHSITKDDMNFILSIRNREAKEFSYPLTKCARIVDRLVEYEFEQKEIYNFNLLEHLLKNHWGSPQCKLFIKQLADEDERSWIFINEFVDKTVRKDLFIRLLGNAWDGMWRYICTNPLLTEDRKTFFFRLILTNIETEQIENMNSNLDISDFMENNADILKRLRDINIASIEAVIERVNVIFTELECDGVAKKLLEFIFENNHYEMNLSMIENIVKIKKPEQVDNLLTSNYTVIRNIEYQPLLSYMDENFTEYINNIVLALDGNTAESMDTVICILEKITDNKDICEALIEKEDVVLQNFKECCFNKIEESEEMVQAIWNKFLSTKKVAVSWSNIMIYWQQFKLTSILLDYIELNIEELLETHDCDSVSDEIIKDVLIEDMGLEAYRKFVSNFKVAEFDIPFTDIPQEQMHVLVQCHYFELTSERFAEMKKNLPEICIEFILCNKEAFLSEIEDYALDISDIESLVVSTELTEDEKLAVISTIDLNVMTLSIARVIRIFKIGVEKNIVEKAWKLLPDEERYELFLNQIALYTKEELASKFAEFKGNYAPLADRTKRHNVILSDTDYNRKLMEYLKSIEYLTSVDYETKKSSDRITYEEKIEKIIIGRVKRQGNA